MVEFHGEVDTVRVGVGVEDEEAAEDHISYEELKKRMWKVRIRLQKLKESGKIIEDEEDREDEEEPGESLAKQEASRRKKMARSQDSILKYMVKIMEVCKAKGFVYGIVPDSGVVSVVDWIDMELDKVNQIDHNNGALVINEQVGGEVSGTKVGDYGSASYWGSGIYDDDDLAMDGAFEIRRGNMDSNLSSEEMLHNDHDSTSIWDLGYE